MVSSSTVSGGRGPACERPGMRIINDQAPTASAGTATSASGQTLAPAQTSANARAVIQMGSTRSRTGSHTAAATRRPSTDTAGNTTVARSAPSASATHAAAGSHTSRRRARSPRPKSATAVPRNKPRNAHVQTSSRGKRSVTSHQ